MNTAAIAKMSWLVLTTALLLWALLFWPTLQQLESVWHGSDTYSHAYFIPLIVLWLFHRSYQQIPQLPKADWRPLLLILPVLLLWLVGFASDTGAIAQLATILCLQLILVSWMGLTLAKHYQFAVFYLIFMLPFGEELHPLLQNMTADLSVWLLRLAAVPVFREGLYLSTPVGHFEVAVACSGLRFLITSLAIGTLFAHLTYQTLWRQLLFMAALVLFSIFANGMRAFLLIYIAEKTEMAYGFGDDHYIYGWLVFGLVLLVMFWLGGKFTDIPAQPAATPAKSAENRQTTTVVSQNAAAEAADILATPIHAQTQLTMPGRQYQGFSVTQLGYLVLLFAGFMLWRVSLPLAPVPETPAAALRFTDATAFKDSDWGINFVASQKQSLLKNAQGTEFYRAVYAHRQQQGELVSWNNQLFKDKKWTIAARQPWQHHQLQAEMLLLKDLSGNSRTLVYWYQIGSQSSVSSWKIKLAQTLALLSGSSQYGQLNAVSVNTELKADDPSLLQAVALLQQMETPHD